VRASASGAAEAVAGANDVLAAFTGDLGDVAARALHAERTRVAMVAEIERFAAFTTKRVMREPPWLGIVRREWQDACVVDRTGVARLVVARARVVRIERSTLGAALPALVEDATAFGDVGRALPDCSLVYGSRVVDFSGLGEAAQIVALAEEELQGVDGAEAVLVVLGARAA